jgi:hypothetical protein
MRFGTFVSVDEAEKSPMELWAERLLQDTFRTKGEFARAAGISASAFSRQISKGKLGIRPLLRLAKATGESASTILHRAGKGEIAGLIEELYGQPRVVERLPLQLVTNELERFSDEFLDLTVRWLKAWTPADQSVSAKEELSDDQLLMRLEDALRGMPPQQYPRALDLVERHLGGGATRRQPKAGADRRAIAPERIASKRKSRAPR